MADRTTPRRPMCSKVGVCESSTVLRQLEAILQANLDPEKEIVAINLVVDLLYTLLDPRIRLGATPG